MPFYIGPLLLVCVIRHFRLSLLNNFYCDILYLYNIVIPTQVQYNICKPEEGWLWPAEILPVMKKQYILFWISSAVVFGLLVFGKKKTIPFGAAHTYIAHKSEYPPPHPPGGQKRVADYESRCLRYASETNKYLTSMCLYQCALSCITCMKPQ